MFTKMAPISTTKAISCRQTESKIPCPAQSKIPFSRKTKTEAVKPKTTNLVSKRLNENTNSIKPIVKPSVTGKSGRTNIIKPIIKKKLPPSLAKNLNGTKPSDIQPVRRKSITKAKDKNRKGLIQSTLPIKQSGIPASYRKNVDAKQRNIQRDKENKILNTTVSQKEPHNDALPSANTSMKALQDKLNLEFVPNEFFRNQILNNKALSFTQLKQFPTTPLKQNALPKTITKQMERMTISGSKLRGSTTKVTRLTGSTSKYSKKTPLSVKNPTSQEIRRCTWTPGIQLQTKPTIDPYKEAVHSIRRLSQRKSNISSNSTSKYGKKTPLSTKDLPLQEIRRCTWTPGIQSQMKRTIDPYQEAMDSIRRLSERKSNVPSSKPHARVALFQSAKTNSWASPEASRRVTWAGGKKIWEKKPDPFIEAISSIKKLKPKNLEPTPTQERRYTWAPGKQPVTQQFDPYEVAMARIKELKTRTPISAKSSPALFTPARTSLKKIDTQQTPMQNLKNGHGVTSTFRRSLFSAEAGNQDESRFGKNKTPEHSTPRRVTFDMSTDETSTIYRPLRALLSKSILKKKARLTDISEHSENDTTCSSQSSGKESDPYPINLLKLRGSLDAKFAAVAPIPAVITTASCENAFELLTTPQTRSSESIVLTPFSRNSSRPPSSKQRKLTPVLKNNSSPFSVNSFPFPSESNVTIKSFFPPIGNFVESTSSSSSEEPSTPVFTPRPLSFYPLRQPSPEELFQTCCKTTPSHDAPICTPLVLKSIARKNQNKELLSPIKQKLDFEELEDDVIKSFKDEPQWTPRYSSYVNNTLTRSKRDDLLADKECERYMAKQHGFFSNCRNFINPIAKSLSIGDNMHFLPVLPEYNE